MKRTIAAFFAVGIVVGSVSSELIRAQEPQYVTRQILQADLNNLPGRSLDFHIDVPAWL
jgi:hypothetical protein